MLGCRAIEAAADAAGDIEGRAYWWSNCIQLRWMLWAMCHAGGPADDAEPDPDSDEFNWVMQVLLTNRLRQALSHHLTSAIIFGKNALLAGLGSISPH